MSVIAACAGSWATVWLLSPRLAQPGPAARPGDQGETIDELGWELAMR